MIIPLVIESIQIITHIHLQHHHFVVSKCIFFMTHWSIPRIECKTTHVFVNLKRERVNPLGSQILPSKHLNKSSENMLELVFHMK